MSLEMCSLTLSMWPASHLSGPIVSPTALYIYKVVSFILWPLSCEYAIKILNETVMRGHAKLTAQRE